MKYNDKQHPSADPPPESSDTPSDYGNGLGEKQDQFSTEHLQKDLKQRSVRGGVVTIASQGARMLLQTGSTAIIARIVSPAEFGLVAMASVFIGFISLFKDLGLSMATVQQAKIEQKQVNALFWINVFISIVLSLAAIAVSPAVAAFYSRPELGMITIAFGSSFVFGGLSAQHTAMLRRQMRFNTLAIIEIASSTTGFATGIAMAMNGFGYWALVAIPIVTGFVTVVLSFSLSGWFPGKPAFRGNVREMLKFGRNITGFTVLNYFVRNFDNLLIGRFVGASALGYYSKAYGLLLLPLTQINRPIGGVAIPALSRLQDKPDEYRRYYLRMIQVVAYASMPITVILGVLSEEVILLLLGDEWLEAVPLFRVFVFFGFWQGISTTTGWILVSLGQTGRMFKWGLIQSSVILTAFLIGIKWGAMGVAIAVTAQAYLIMVPSFLFATRHSPISLKQVISAIARPIALALIIMACCLLVYFATLNAHMSLRIGGVMITAAAVVLACYSLWKAFRMDVRTVLAQLKI